MFNLRLKLMQKIQYISIWEFMNPFIIWADCLNKVLEPIPTPVGQKTYENPSSSQGKTTSESEHVIDPGKNLVLRQEQYKIKYRVKTNCVLNTLCYGHSHLGTIQHLQYTWHACIWTTGINRSTQRNPCRHRSTNSEHTLRIQTHCEVSMQTISRPSVFTFIYFPLWFKQFPLGSVAFSDSLAESNGAKTKNILLWSVVESKSKKKKKQFLKVDILEKHLHTLMKHMHLITDKCTVIVKNGQIVLKC